MAATNRNICDGCPKTDRAQSLKDIKCECFNKYHTMVKQQKLVSEARVANATTPPGTSKYPGLSIAQIAEKLGVSKSEVRRRKLEGTI